MQLRLLLWQALLVAAFCCVQGAVAQDPVGSFQECGPGKTYLIRCYFNRAGYLADVVHRNTIPPTDVAICNAPQQQLQQITPTTIEVSASDSIVRMVVCDDSTGVRGLAFFTALGERLECGTVSKECTPYSSRGTFPLGGFTGSCEATKRGWPQQRLTVVTRVFGACWNTQPAVRQAACPPGAGTPGGGQACVACQPGFYSKGGTGPCIPCPDGLTTIAPGSSACGYFPGYGVYGPINQDPNVCELCPAGTYAIGGALAPCQPCSSNAFDYLTSAPGSLSIADCTCAAGFGSTDANPKSCSICPLGTFNEGPLPRAEQGAAAAAASEHEKHKSSSSNSRGRSSSRHSSISGGSASRIRSSSRGHRVSVAGVDTTMQTIASADAQQQQQQQQQQQRRLHGHSEDGTAVAQLSTPALAEDHLAAAAAATDSAVATAAVVTPQQFTNSWGWLRNSGVNPVFFEPTFNPCTPCGPACWTDSPGSTSPSQCKCERPRSPSPSPSPSPMPSPSPSPSTSPSPPSPSPSPTPSSPSPTPSPSPSPPTPGPSPSPIPQEECLVCYPDGFDQDPTLASLCAIGSTVEMTGHFCDSVSLSVSGNLAFTTTPTNIFKPNSDLIDCSIVKENPDEPLTFNYGLKSGTPQPTDCQLPDPVDFTLPDISAGKRSAGSPVTSGNLREVTPPGSNPILVDSGSRLVGHPTNPPDSTSPGEAGAPPPAPALTPNAPTGPPGVLSPTSGPDAPTENPEPGVPGGTDGVADDAQLAPVPAPAAPAVAAPAPELLEDPAILIDDPRSMPVAPPPAPAPAPTPMTLPAPNMGVQGMTGAPAEGNSGSEWLNDVPSQQLEASFDPTAGHGAQGKQAAPVGGDSSSDWLNAVPSDQLEALFNTSPGSTGPSNSGKRVPLVNPDTDWLNPVPSDQLEAPFTPTARQNPSSSSTSTSSSGGGGTSGDTEWLNPVRSEELDAPFGIPPAAPSPKGSEPSGPAPVDSDSEWLNAVPSEQLNTPFNPSAEQWQGPTSSSSSSKDSNGSIAPGTDPDAEWLNAVPSEELNAPVSTPQQQPQQQQQVPDQGSSSGRAHMGQRFVPIGIRVGRDMGRSKQTGVQPGAQSDVQQRGEGRTDGQQPFVGQQQPSSSPDQAPPKNPSVHLIGQGSHLAPWVRKVKKPSRPGWLRPV